jgi:hypothetical protein
MNLNVIEMVSIDHKSTAKLLHTLSRNCSNKSSRNGNNGRANHYTINKMMDNICWFLGSEPDMVLNGKVTPPDIVAQSILDLPLVCGAFAYYIIEIVNSSVQSSSESNESSENAKDDSEKDKSPGEVSSSQYIGACITFGEEFVAQEISCYLFIDWLNIQDTTVNSRQVKK